jgi:hypothetical protein
MVRSGLLLAAVVGAGCHATALHPPAHPAPPQLPVAPRGTVTPGVTAAPAGGIPSRPAQYRHLTAAECRALAVRTAPLAAELDTHPDNDPPHPAFGKRTDLAHHARLARGHAADELRNRAAADALDLYGKLAAAEGQFDLVAEAHGLLRTQLTAAEQAVAAGLRDRADVDRLRRQLLELESRAAKLEAGAGALNAGLGGRLGLDPADPLPVWPADPLRVGDEVPDADRAVRSALHYRPDLNLLRVLAAGPDGLTNAVLNGINPLLGAADSSHPLAAALAALKKEPTRAEATLQRQLAATLRTRERQAEAEVRAAVAAVRGERAAAAAKAAEVRNLADKVAEVEKRAAAGVAGAEAELAAARLDLLKLRGELVQAAADWHAADVKLRQATGALVRE